MIEHDSDLLTTSEVAERLGIAIDDVQLLCRTRLLPSTKIHPHRRCRYFIARGTVEQWELRMAGQREARS